MKKKDIEHLKRRFLEYVDYYITQAENPGPFILKKQHTFRVCSEILSLGEHLSLSEQELLTAEAAALLHDIGRFKQFQTYHTFLDQRSEDHAELGLKEIKQEDLLDFCTGEEVFRIENAIRYHNAADLPEELKSEERNPDELKKDALFLLRLLRDADKLDIWRVVTDHYASPQKNNKKAINLGLEDDGQLSSEAVRAVCQEEFVRSHMIKRLNDLKLMQISWIFDLNFAWSVARAANEKFIEKIAATMPVSRALEDALTHVNAYMESHGKDSGTV
ncbi:MAG: HD domain-containing protein [Thermodesulfobacteriota bacterium]|nr:HD domain-containing protein [Thermodesulfobacteriota bacterium]